MGDEFDLFREDAADAGAAVAATDEKPTLLIIDDDGGIRDSLELALKKKFNTVLCSNGADGVEAASDQIHCVILDVKMDGKDGFQTFTEIKQKFSHLPIIFHSAYQDLKNPYEIMNDYRPFGYINKEGSFRELLDTINSAVGYYTQVMRNQKLVTELTQLNDELEDKVVVRTSEITAQKEKQDGDYYLTSLLSKPLAANNSKNDVVDIEFIIEQR